jgi:hypothetical protein
MAQDVPNTDAYLAQAAAVVDGYSGGGPVWVVFCGTSSPYEVIGAYPTAAQANEALAAATTAGKTCWIAGPYRSEPRFPEGVITYGAVCKKAWDSSCLSDTSRAVIAPVTEVNLVTVTTYLRNGRVVTDSFRPQDVEAMFFTMSAVDKLLIPYYVRVYGVEYAAQQRAFFLRRTWRLLARTRDEAVELGSPCSASNHGERAM